MSDDKDYEEMNAGVGLSDSERLRLSPTDVLTAHFQHGGADSCYLLPNSFSFTVSVRSVATERSFESYESTFPSDVTADDNRSCPE